jgi:hypothetical protein
LYRYAEAEAAREHAAAMSAVATRRTADAAAAADAQRALDNDDATYRAAAADERKELDAWVLREAAAAQKEAADRATADKAAAVAAHATAMGELTKRNNEEREAIEAKVGGLYSC